MNRKKQFAGFTACVMMLTAAIANGAFSASAAGTLGDYTWEIPDYQPATTAVSASANSVTATFADVDNDLNLAGFCTVLGGEDWSGYETVSFTLENKSEDAVAFAMALGTGGAWAWHQSDSIQLSAGQSKDVTLYLNAPEWTFDGEATVVNDLYQVQRINMMVMAPNATKTVSGSLTVSDWKLTAKEGGDEPIIVEPKDGFYVSGNTLFDANQKPFLMRGVNYAYTWFSQDDPEKAMKELAGYGVNTVRLVLSNGVQYSKNPAGQVEKLIDICEKNKLVAVLEVHDATGRNSEEDLLKAAEYFAEIKSALVGHENTVIINIANEWQGTTNAGEWRSAYINAVKIIRDAGLLHCIMCDAGGWGQGASVIPAGGAAVLASDPEKNVMFSIHMYGTAGGSASVIKSNIDNVLQQNLCLCIGEFGYKHSDGDVDEAYIMSYCKTTNVGWMAWSWYGNGGGVEYLDLSSANIGGTLSPEWGEVVINGENGIKATSEVCSVFEDAPIVTTVTTETTTTTTTTTVITGTTPVTTSEVTTIQSTTTTQQVITTNPGDVNNDGKVDVSDIILLARYVAEDPEIAPLSETGKQNADCDGESNITAGDVAKIARVLAHLDTF